MLPQLYNAFLLAQAGDAAGRAAVLARAISLAQRLGIQTRANTLKGLIRACQGASLRPQAWPPMKRPLPSSRRLSVAALAKGWDQKRWRVRTIDPFMPLYRAVQAVLGENYIDTVGAVPNAYRGDAQESVCTAQRVGQAVMVAWDRAEMAHTSHGAGRREYLPASRQFIMARDLLQAFRPPQGYQWRLDLHGICLTGPDIADFHPLASDLAAIARPDPRSREDVWNDCLEAARENMRRRKAQSAASRAERLLARISGKLTATVQDARQCGFCERGIAIWREQAGIPDDATEIPLRDLVAAAARTGDCRALVVAHHVARRALDSRANPAT